MLGARSARGAHLFLQRLARTVDADGRIVRGNVLLVGERLHRSTIVSQLSAAFDALHEGVLQDVFGERAIAEAPLQKFTINLPLYVQLAMKVQATAAWASDPRVGARTLVSA